MLVYGDPQHHLGFEPLVRGLQARCQRTRWQDPDSVRALFVLAGQLEQAAFDCWTAEDSAQRVLLANIQRATDIIAEEFFPLWNGTGGRPERTRNELAQVLSNLDSAARVSSPMLTLKIPEGFQFYTLFPEQYFAAALDWAAAHSTEPHKRALVVGIRSIGTTLSAAVRAALLSQNWEVERITVRPAGHPFNRSVTLQGSSLNSTALGLVVDEGPGLSGSSMAAVAESLSRARITRISFLPGHSNEPGVEATPQTRSWWANTPRYVAPIEKLRWHGTQLAGSLVEVSRGLVPEATGANDITIQDLSGGAWRRLAYSGEQDWPAVCAAFERQKFVVHSGGRARCLWKFAGLGSQLAGEQTSAEAVCERWGALAQMHWAPRPLATFRGFLAVEWVDGRRLVAADAREPALLLRLADYIQQAAQANMTAAEGVQALRRLSNMLCWNTRETLGDAAAEQARNFEAAAANEDPIASYGDGRMAPWEWVQTSCGRILKTDCVGHDSDHTLIGSQPVSWDVAGTVVEWKLGSEATNHLLRGLRWGGIRISKVPLRFYSCAYAAFRAGMVTLALSQSSDSLEQGRLHLAREYYASKLKFFLQDEAAFR